MNKLTLIAFSFSLPFISACSVSMPEMPEMPEMPSLSKLVPDLSLPTVYRDDVNQGSVLERFKVNQLKIGMSKAQVQELIGSPSVVDPFHNNEWLYINHSILHEKEDVKYQLALVFEGSTLTSIDTSGLASLPEMTEDEKQLEAKRKTQTQEVLPLLQAQ